MPLFDWIRSDLHSLNLDWIISKIKTVEESEQGAVDAAADANTSKTAAAASATAANNSKTAAAGSATLAAVAAQQAQNLVDQLDTTIAQDVSDWLDEHITPTTPAVDDTLTVSGAAADAAVTGDKITELKTDLQHDMKAIGESLGFYPLEWTGFGWIPTNKQVGDTVNISDVRTSSIRTRYYLIPCAEGDKFTITAEGGTTSVRIVTFLDENDTVLFITPNRTTAVNKVVYTAPENSALLLIQDTGGNYQYKGIYTDIDERITNVQEYAEETAESVNHSITIVKSATVTNADFTLKSGKQYKLTNTGADTVSFRTMRHGSNEILQQVNILRNSSRMFDCTADADVISLYESNLETYTVIVEDVSTVEYRLNDNTARIDALEFDGVPTYFRTMMNTKLPIIRENMNAVGQNGDTFVFITDIHWQNNAKNSIGLIRYIINNTNINKVVCGGDIIGNGERDAMMNAIITVIKGMEFPFHNDLLVAFGNHDSNKFSQPEATEKHFSLNACYALMEKQSESYITMMTDFDLSFYYDNKANKTRYIVLDMGEDLGASGRVFTAFQQFADAMMDTPEDWHIIVVAHIVTYGRFIYIEHMMDAYNSRDTYSQETVGSYDFSDAQAEVAFAIGGHTHVDSEHTTSGGIPVIVTTTDSYRLGDTDPYPYVVGTDQEQCFDVVTVDYTNKTIKCVRIGRGVDRTFTY